MNNQNYINHIVLVLDASYSMISHKNALVQVADNQIKYLAQRSKELDQETRITIYTFHSSGQEKCLVYDKDVLRTPSISGLYKTGQNTALIDATLLALGDLSMTPEKYGEHSFLVYVLTDGEENDSHHKSYELSERISALPDNWTLATFVPNQRGVFEAKKFGFPKDNIAVWDTTSTEGLEEAGQKIKDTTDHFMRSRVAGIRGTKNLFTMQTLDVSNLPKTLTSLHGGQFRLLDVNEKCRIDNFVESNLNRAYILGEAYYQLSKNETIQPQKKIAILNKGRLYVGDNARSLLGLPMYDVKVKPSDYSDYTIFVQSTSVNRNLMPNTKLLILS